METNNNATVESAREQLRVAVSRWTAALAASDAAPDDAPEVLLIALSTEFGAAVAAKVAASAALTAVILAARTPQEIDAARAQAEASAACLRARRKADRVGPVNERRCVCGGRTSVAQDGQSCADCA